MPVRSGALAGRTALVTGGASGMGRATALRLARAGADVVVGDLLEDAGARTVEAIAASGGHARFARLDVTREQEWEELAAELRSDAGLDAMVHCAGIGSAAAGEGAMDAYRALMEVNALGTMLALQTAVGLMRGRGGSIVAIGSVASVVAIGSPDLPVGYNASKGAVRMLVRAVAAQEGRHGIRVNCILPGFMPPMRGSRMPQEDGGGSPFLPRIPLGRIGSHDDVASAAMFLVSDESAYITGTDLVVDGGYLA
jgi:NAD(P)-dependent dehydrogenase (short-subunit alcohol dehydrogenase family)